MKKNAALQLLLINVVGAVAMAVCLLTSLWLVFVRADETSREIHQHQDVLSSAQRDLAAIRGIAATQQGRLSQARSELETSGRLPSRTPIEQYSQEVLRLANLHGLRVTRQHPVPPRDYPGLFEQRYAYEVSGSTVDIVHFLAAIEAANFWADIGYLRLDAGPAPAARANAVRVASITVSLFSAPPSDSAKEGEG